MGRYRYHIFACTNQREPDHRRGSCAARGSEEILKAFREELKLHPVPQPFRINKSGCLDACEDGPVFAVYPDGIYYRIRSREDARRIVTEHLVGGRIVSDLQILPPPELS